MDITDRLGDVHREDQHWVLRFERELDHPPEKVWRALTESEHLEHWLPCDLVGERRAGAAIELPFWPATVARYGLEETPVLPGRITVWDPPAVFEWWWDTDRVRFELDRTSSGTRLRFTTWIPDDSRSAPPLDTGAGYHVCLDRLCDELDGHGTPMADDAVVATVNARYEAAFAATHPKEH